MVGLKIQTLYTWLLFWVLSHFSYLSLADNDGSVSTENFDLLVTGPMPTFVYNDTCEQLPAMVGIEPSDSAPKSPYPVGTDIELKCKDGYQPQPGKTNVASCRLNGSVASWVMPTIQCRPVACPEPPKIDNGRHEGHLFTFPNSVTYKCNGGYDLQGKRQIYCQPSGTWTGGPNPAKCVKINCTQPPNLPNGSVNAPSWEFNAKATYQCNEGFVLLGPRVRVCLANKTWSSSEIVCQEVRCPIPQNFPGHTVNITGSNIPGGKVLFICKDQTGHVTLTCLDTGKWSGSIPNCKGAITSSSTEIPTTTTTTTTTTVTQSNPAGPGSSLAPSLGPFGCKLDPKFPNGKYNDSLPSDGHFLYLTYLKFECNSGYKLEGEPVSVCQRSGKWKPPIPKCKKPFPTMVVVIVAVVSAVVMGVICGVIQWCRYRRRTERNMGTISKARLSDARDYEETKNLGKEKAIPVTVL